MISKILTLRTIGCNYMLDDEECDCDHIGEHKNVEYNEYNFVRRLEQTRNNLQKLLKHTVICVHTDAFIFIRTTMY